MFAEMEAGLVDLVRNSQLKSRLAVIDTLPDDDEDNLVKRFAADAPAVYVVAGKPVKVADGNLVVSFGFACVARNARGHQDARRGDGLVIGMYQILEGVLGLAEHGRAGGYLWTVADVGFLNSDKLWSAGLTVGVVTVQTTVTMPAGIDESTLGDFITFHADFDIPPHEAAAEHQKWVQEPADYSTSKPELQDTLTIQS